jgi:hypothetical protein
LSPSLSGAVRYTTDPSSDRRFIWLSPYHSEQIPHCPALPGKGSLPEFLPAEDAQLCLLPLAQFCSGDIWFGTGPFFRKVFFWGDVLAVPGRIYPKCLFPTLSQEGGFLIFIKEVSSIWWAEIGSRGVGADPKPRGGLASSTSTILTPRP